MKSMLGYVFKMVGVAISWKGVKQTMIASSTMQAEFVACYGVTIQVVWLSYFVSALCFVDSISNSIEIYYDNVSVDILF